MARKNVSSSIIRIRGILFLSFLRTLVFLRFLGETEDFGDGREPVERFQERVLAEREYLLPFPLLLNLREREALLDEALRRGREHENFRHGDAADVPGIVAAIAPFAVREDGLRGILAFFEIPLRDVRQFRSNRRERLRVNRLR